MNASELRDTLLAITSEELGTTRSNKPAIAIIPPDFENGTIEGVAIAINRVPIGDKIPSRIGSYDNEIYGDQLFQYHKKWTIKIVNYSNSSASSETLEKIKNIIEHHFVGRIINNEMRYFPPSNLNKEQINFQLYDPEMIKG